MGSGDLEEHVGITKVEQAPTHRLKLSGIAEIANCPFTPVCWGVGAGPLSMQAGAFARWALTITMIAFRVNRRSFRTPYTKAAALREHELTYWRQGWPHPASGGCTGAPAIPGQGSLDFSEHASPFPRWRRDFGTWLSRA